MEQVNILRQSLLVVLFCIFAWQTYQSFERFLERKTTISTQTLMEFEQEFPGLSLCPASSVGKNQLFTKNQTIQQELESTSLPFNILAKHVFESTAAVNVTEKNLPEDWKITVTFDMYNHRLKKCYTYKSNRKFRNGYLSLLNLAIYGENIPDIFMFIHPPNDSLLTLSRIFYREFSIVPQPRGNLYRELSYEINQRKIKMVPKPQTPCQEDGNVNVQDCIESYIEMKSGCILPWRMKDQSGQKACTNSTLFKSIHFDLTIQGEYQIFEKTKCQQSCNLMEYPVIKVGDRLRDYDNNSSGRTVDFFYLGLYLRSGGIPYQEEVRVYTLLDFVGNVGGFLGLLLGASLLSVFDQMLVGLRRCQNAK